MEATSSHRAPTGPLLTTVDVAEMLAVNSRTVRRLADRGELPRVRLGRRTVRFEPAAVEAFIARRRQTSPEMSETVRAKDGSAKTARRRRNAEA